MDNKMKLLNVLGSMVVAVIAIIGLKIQLGEAQLFPNAVKVPTPSAGISERRLWTLDGPRALGYYGRIMAIYPLQGIINGQEVNDLLISVHFRADQNKQSLPDLVARISSTDGSVVWSKELRLDQTDTKLDIDHDGLADVVGISDDHVTILKGANGEVFWSSVEEVNDHLTTVNYNEHKYIVAIYEFPQGDQSKINFYDFDINGVLQPPMNPPQQLTEAFLSLNIGENASNGKPIVMAASKTSNTIYLFDLAGAQTGVQGSFADWSLVDASLAVNRGKDPGKDIVLAGDEGGASSIIRYDLSNLAQHYWISPDAGENGNFTASAVTPSMNGDSWEDILLRRDPETVILLDGQTGKKLWEYSGKDSAFGNFNYLTATNPISENKNIYPYVFIGQSTSDYVLAIDGVSGQETYFFRAANPQTAIFAHENKLFAASGMDESSPYELLTKNTVLEAFEMTPMDPKVQLQQLKKPLASPGIKVK